MKFIAKLADKLMMSEGELLSFALTMPRRYKKYYIPKRNSEEMRLIAQPSQEAKFIQRVLVDELRPYFPVHSAATAYEKGVGIRLNADLHRNSRYLLKMDFKNFFPSITPELFFLVSHECGIDFEQVDKVFLENALFFRKIRRSRLRLSIGAPSSPFISNFVMSRFDDAVATYCASKNIAYTRYADDITFTTAEKGALFEVPAIVNAMLERHCFRKIRINTAKTVYSSKARNRHVTGIVLTNEDKLSVGRARKREVSSLINSFRFGCLDFKECLRLKGLLAYIHNIEPDFILRMKAKYSSDVIDAIFRMNEEVPAP